MNTTTSKRLLSLLLALITALSLCVPVFATDGTGNGGGTTGETTTSVSTIVDATLSSTLAQEKAALTSPDFGSEWVILGLARSGYLEKGSKYFNDYYTRVAAYASKATKNAQELGAPAGALHLVKCTENSRLIIALSALGRDARSVGECDLTAPYEKFSWIEGQGLNSVVFALIALDTVGYETKDTTIRQQCISYILDRQLSDGGWNYQEDAATSDPDMTAMSLQALANYQEQEKVQAAVSAAVGRLSAMQNSDGSYTSYEAVNSESISQVIVACAALGIDPHTDSRFVKNGKSAVDALLTFYNTEKRAFHHAMKDKDGNPTDVDGMATEQAAYAMTAYQRLMNRKTSLYDMSDVAKDCAAGEHTFGDWKETVATCTEAGTKTHTCTKCGRSEFVETTSALGHKSGSGYEMSDTKHWFPCVLCGAHLKEANHKYTGDQCVVCNYHKVGGRIEITPLTTLPAALQSVSALSNMTKLKSQMVTAVQKVDKNIKAENTQMLDVTLMIPSVVDNKTVWSPAAKDSFPANGKITVLLPYPEGTGMSGYEFVVVHVFTTDDFDKKVGNMESPSVTKTTDGLQVTTTGLSPIMIGWKDGSDSAKGARTDDAGQMGLWACGVLVSTAAIVVLTQKKKRSAK